VPAGVPGADVPPDLNDCLFIGAVPSSPDGPGATTCSATAPPADLDGPSQRQDSNSDMLTSPPAVTNKFAYTNRKALLTALAQEGFTEGEELLNTVAQDANPEK
jgi:hypothetical protein